jgi:hypothetical protein
MGSRAQDKADSVSPILFTRSHIMVQSRASQVQTYVGFCEFFVQGTGLFSCLEHGCTVLGDIFLVNVLQCFFFFLLGCWGLHSLASI